MLRLGIAAALILVGFTVLMLERLPRSPSLERLLGRPASDDEIAVVAGHRTQQHELLEPWLLVDHPGAGGESTLQLGTGTFWDLNCVDLHHGHR